MPPSAAQTPGKNHRPRKKPRRSDPTSSPPSLSDGRLPQKAFQAQSLSRAKTPYPGYFKIPEQGLDAPPVGIRLDGGGQRGIGGQQQAHSAGALRQLAPPDDDTLEEARATHGMAKPGRPAAIASNGVDRGGQCCNRIGIKARAIEPRTATPSGLAR